MRASSIALQPSQSPPIQHAARTVPPLDRNDTEYWGVGYGPEGARQSEFNLEIAFSAAPMAVGSEVRVAWAGSPLTVLRTASDAT